MIHMQGVTAADKAYNQLQVLSGEAVQLQKVHTDLQSRVGRLGAFTVTSGNNQLLSRSALFQS